MASRIINFLRGDAKDYKGRVLRQMQFLPNNKMEREHDVIQWMFPSDIPSKHYQEAPVLSDEDIATMKVDSIIQAAIHMSLTRMIWFYEKDDYWITQKNHNFLRITRILRCLWLAGMKHDYVSLQKALDDVFIEYADIIGEETYVYWKNANNDEFMKDPIKRDQILSYYRRAQEAPTPVKETPSPVKEAPFNPIQAAIEFGGNQTAELTDEESEGLGWRYV